MRLRSIGARLTIRYAAAFACALVLLGAGTLLVVRQNLYHAIDDSLGERVEGIRRFIEEHQTRLALPEVKDEFRAHGDYFRVDDEAGRVLYRTESMRGVPPPADDTRIGTAGIVDDVVTREGVPLRRFTRTVLVDGQRYMVQVATPLADLERGLTAAVGALLPMFPLVLLIAAAGGYWLSRRALTPVDDITQAARSITSDNLSLRLSVPKTGDELERLSTTLNEMIERLEHAFKRVSQFTLDASHELRTPLAVMRTTAEVALRSDEGDADRHEAIETILVELERTSELVENLLVIAKADAGNAQLPRRRINFVESVGEACREAGVLAQAKGISLRTELPEEPLWIEADAHSIRRLFLILLDNAIKYTPPGGRCEVIVTVSGRSVVGAVRDTGIGIAQAELDRIFERFYRIDRARSRDRGGAGLGLAIGRWIVEAHKGNITAASAGHCGSEFRVELPLLAEGWGPNRIDDDSSAALVMPGEDVSTRQGA